MAQIVPTPTAVRKHHTDADGQLPPVAVPLRAVNGLPARTWPPDFPGQPARFPYNWPVQADPGQGVQNAGSYRLFAEIAAGGMATVHLGHHLDPTYADGPYGTVAVKRLHSQFTRDDEFVTMFADEARLVTRIRHPNVVQTLDVVQDKGELSLIMEYVHGESFSKLLGSAYRAGSPATAPVVRRVMVDVLRGLHGAHEATDEYGRPLQIVHRDVSPQNIIVGADGIARVLDFGIAKAIGRASITRDNEVRGKIAYMAPEQLQRAGVDRRTDIYAASIILWEALTCKRLFQANSEAATLARVMNLHVSPPSHYRSAVSPQLDSVVLRGLSRDPRLRFGSAWDMAAALAASGPCASRAELAEWVQTIAAEKLTERAQLVSTMRAAIAHSAAPASAAASQRQVIAPARQHTPPNSSVVPTHTSWAQAQTPPVSSRPPQAPINAWAAQAQSTTAAPWTPQAAAPVAAEDDFPEISIDLSQSTRQSLRPPAPTRRWLRPLAAIATLIASVALGTALSSQVPASLSQSFAKTLGLAGAPIDGSHSLESTPPRSASEAEPSNAIESAATAESSNLAAQAGSPTSNSTMPSASSAAAPSADQPTSEQSTNTQAVSAQAASVQARGATNAASPAARGAATTLASAPAQRRPAAKATRANCEPPYVVDAEGIRRYKPHCL